MSEPRRHHFISEMQQRRFVDQNGQLFVFDKRRREKGVFKTKPKQWFVQKDLNTFQRTDGTRSVALERWYSQIEGEVAPVIHKIIERARCSQEPGLNAEERDTWDCFFYHQHKRAPDVFERLNLVEQFHKDLPRFVEEYERLEGPLTEQERERIFSPKGRQQLLQNAGVLARGRGSDEIRSILANLGVAVAVVQSPNKSFILGDHPHARMGEGGALGDPATEIWLPIAADVAVSPWGSESKERLHFASSDEVRRANKAIFNQSNMVGGRSEKLIRSLAGI